MDGVNKNAVLSRGAVQRVVVVGTSCSGKTTLARRIARILAVPHVELDAIHWGPNWQEASAEEFRALVDRATSADGWVLDGNYSVVEDLVFPRATDVIWLNYSFPAVFGRALRRTIRRVVDRQELFSGNRETFGKAFLSRESILWWVITTYRRRRRRYRALFTSDRYPNISLTELRRTVDADRFVDALANCQDERPGCGWQ
jgi:adenylate kinase family enzyme